MVIKEVGKRGVSFTFEDNITIYLINTDNRMFLCDTHLGPLSMEYIKQYISACTGEKDLIIFNSHSDWDHIWGNCAFDDALILGHETCRNRMQERGEYDLERYSKNVKGTVKLKLPDLTFDSKITFEEEHIEFIYAPGHTIDSSVCFDRKDSVLFVGDLVENPIPYLSYIDLAGYIKTLEFIREFPADIKICAHSGIIDGEIINKNISYIENILHGRSVEVEDSREFEYVHTYNVKNMLLLNYESRAREKLGERFNFRAFRKGFEDLSKIDKVGLEKALEHRINEIV